MDGTDFDAYWKNNGLGPEPPSFWWLRDLLRWIWRHIRKPAP